jgi:molecular chaperone DnaK
MESEVSDKKTEQEHGENIGTAVLTLPAGLPAGSPIKITFTINTEGRLDMRAVEETENRVIETSIDTKSVISDEELELAKQRSQSVKIM